MEPVVGGRTVLGVVYMRESITAGHDRRTAGVRVSVLELARWEAELP